MAESAFAKHIVSSIRNELELLKTHNYLQPQAYDEILRLLPTNIGMNRDMPGMNSGGYPPAPNAAAYGASPAPSHNSMPPTPAGSVAPPPPPPSYNDANHLGTAEALYDYNGENPNTDLSFRRGDTIQLTELLNDDWWKGSLHGKTGIFPRNYVKKNEPVVSEKMTSPPPPPPTNRQTDNYGGYSPMPPKQDSYDYPPPPQQQRDSYSAPPPMSNNNYPPPPPLQQQQSYQSQPPPPQAQSYQSPPPQQQSYAPPPEQQVYPPPLASTSSAPAAVEQPHEESKFSAFGKRFATKIGDSATFGFGSTIGSNVANSIF